MSGCLFASPRTGDPAWADLFAVTVKDYRLFNYILDIVTRVPTLGYATLPNATVIQPSTAQAGIRLDILCNHHVIRYCAMIDYKETMAAPTTAQDDYQAKPRRTKREIQNEALRKAHARWWDGLSPKERKFWARSTKSKPKSKWKPTRKWWDSLSPEDQALRAKDYVTYLAMFGPLVDERRWQASIDKEAVRVEQAKIVLAKAKGEDDNRVKERALVAMRNLDKKLNDEWS